MTRGAWALGLGAGLTALALLTVAMPRPAFAQSSAGAAAPAATARPAHGGQAADEPSAAPRMPRYLLQGSHGRAVTSEDFRGRFQLIAFGFTSCPDVCPTTMIEMQQVLAALGDRARRLQPLFISVDPERDSLVVLRAYTESIDPRILGLTGSEALVRRAADAFGVQYRKVRDPGSPPQAYTVDHTAGMFLVGPDGQLLQKIGYGTPVPEIVARIERWMAAAQ